MHATIVQHTTHTALGGTRSPNFDIIAKSRCLRKTAESVGRAVATATFVVVLLRPISGTWQGLSDRQTQFARAVIDAARGRVSSNRREAWRFASRASRRAAQVWIVNDAYLDIDTSNPVFLSVTLNSELISALPRRARVGLETRVAERDSVAIWRPTTASAKNAAVKSRRGALRRRCPSAAGVCSEWAAAGLGARAWQTCRPPLDLDRD